VNKQNSFCFHKRCLQGARMNIENQKKAVCKPCEESGEKEKFVSKITRRGSQLQEENSWQTRIPTGGEKKLGTIHGLSFMNIGGEWNGMALNGKPE